MFNVPVYKDHSRDQNAVFIDRWLSVRTALLGPWKGSLYKQVVFIHRWSFGQVGRYFSTILPGDKVLKYVNLHIPTQIQGTLTPPALRVAWCLIWWSASIEKHMVLHDTECPYWDQVSLNNTKLQTYKCEIGCAILDTGWLSPGNERQIASYINQVDKHGDIFRGCLVMQISRHQGWMTQ